jgi:hypothetical protein
LRVGRVDGCCSSNPMCARGTWNRLRLHWQLSTWRWRAPDKLVVGSVRFAIIVRSRPSQNHHASGGEDEPRGPVGRVTTASPPQDNRSVWIWMVITANLRRSCLVVRSRASTWLIDLHRGNGKPEPNPAPLTFRGRARISRSFRRTAPPYT